MSLRHVHSFLMALFVASSLGSELAADEFQILDKEGFDRALVAKVATVPKGWASSGRIAWNKPCSSNDLFELIFLTQSPDGSAGARIMPGYQILQDRAVLTPGYPPDPMLAMMISQSEAFNREMATKFRGSNCAVGQLVGTESILRALILRNRPSNVRVVSARADQSNIDDLRMVFGQGMPGVSVNYDAQIIELQYTRNGVPTTELLYLSWYSFINEPIDLGGVTVSNTHTIVEPLRIVWAPTSQAPDLLPKIDSIFSAIRTNPEWQRRVDAVLRKLQEQRDKDRVARNEESDRKHREFIDYITDGGASVGSGASGGSGTGSVATPSTGAEAGKESDTDFWGEPKEKTDYWGEPKEKTDYWGEPVKDD